MGYTFYRRKRFIVQFFVQEVDDAGLSLLLSIDDGDEEEDNTDFFPRQQVVLSTMKKSKLGSLITPNKTQFEIYFINKLL